MAVEPSVYRAIFVDDKRGAAILDELLSKFVRGSVLKDDGILSILQTYDHGGMRKPLDFILKRINNDPEIEDTPEAKAP